MWWEGCVGFEKLIQKFGLFLRSAQLSWDVSVKLRSLNWITFRPAGKSTRTDECKFSHAKVSKLLEFSKDQPSGKMSRKDVKVYTSVHSCFVLLLDRSTCTKLPASSQILY